MPKYTLYGDGIHDDTPAIQELIDSGVCEVELPAPSVCYLISKPIIIPSSFKLKLPRFAHIKLMDGANCFMLQNKFTPKPAKRLNEDFGDVEKAFWWYCDEFSANKEDICHDFEIEGGIWDFNNMNQDPNPIQTRTFDERHYNGNCMVFYNVRNFKLSNMTLKDPSNFAITLDTASYFTVENITFDFNFGNPYALNMDGVHLNGNCHYGTIKNLKGACYDDLIALNAHEGSGGDITNIVVDGIFAENCHSAVRFLTVRDKLQNIKIANVYGTFYQYCVGFTKGYPGEFTGCFDAIVLENFHVSKSKRLPVQEMHMADKTYQFPLIWIPGPRSIKTLTIEHLHRREREVAAETIGIGDDVTIERLILNDVSVSSEIDGECPTITNDGKIQHLISNCLSKNDLEGHGIVEVFN